MFNHGYPHPYILLTLLLPHLTMVKSQPSDNVGYASFSPTMAVIIGVLVASLFLMAFFSIYIRHFSDTAATAASALGRARSRRAATARGLDRTVIESSFPKFSYSEVVDHKIGKGTLECAVCLNEFEEHDTLRLIPKCDHVFHPECIDAWLECHVTCPVCRANLIPQIGEDERLPIAESTDAEIAGSNRSRNEEIVIDVVDNNTNNNNNEPNQNPSRPPLPPRAKSIRRTWSIRRPRLFSFAKFRSHSTGHWLIGENLDRFTLRLPAEVRKDVMNRAMLNRTTTLPVEPSSRSGYRIAEEERGDATARIDGPDRWWMFRKSQKVGAETVEGSALRRTGSLTAVRLPSFRCLEPKADAEDETRLFSGRGSG